MFEKRIDIRWRDLDSSLHVNNAVYLTYLEEVRTGWLTQRLGAGAISEFVLVRVAIDFRRELTLADEAVVATCSLQRVGESSVGTTEQIRTAAGDLVAEAEAVAVAWDPGTAKSRPLSAAERAALTA
jgi:acyl-CoA thioester hydrolase